MWCDTDLGDEQAPGANWRVLRIFVFFVGEFVRFYFERFWVINLEVWKFLDMGR